MHSPSDDCLRSRTCDIVHDNWVIEMYLTLTAASSDPRKVRRSLLGASSIRKVKQDWGTIWVICTQAAGDYVTIALIHLLDKYAHYQPIVDCQQPYLSDASYVANGYTSAALAGAFEEALANRPLKDVSVLSQVSEWHIKLPCVTCAPDDDLLVYQLFCPLGYKVVPKLLSSQDTFPMRGVAPVYEVWLTGSQQTQDVLAHLCVLLSVIDPRGSHHVKWDTRKLRHLGGSWLPAHPEREFITQRLLHHRLRFLHGASYSHSTQKHFTHTAYHADRHSAVLRAAADIRARSIADIGCGDGTLLELALQTPEFETVLGVDISQEALARAKRRLAATAATSTARLSLRQGSALVYDSRLQGLDFVSLVEVIEHLEPTQIDAMERAIFGAARPRRVAITTPNREYNRIWDDQRSRHHDHRFEWGRTDCLTWAGHILEKYRYKAELRGLGPDHPDYGALTHLIILDRIDESDQTEDTSGTVNTKYGAARRATSPPELSTGASAKSVDSIHSVSTFSPTDSPLVDAAEVLSRSRYSFTTSPWRTITIGAKQTADAFERIGRYGVDARWLVYLPPLVSTPVRKPRIPSQPDLSYLVFGQPCLVCKKSHVGRHCTIVLCRNEATAIERFGMPSGLDVLGACYSPWGRPIFDVQTEHNLLVAFASYFEQVGFWQRMRSNWVCLEARLSPYSIAGDFVTDRPHRNLETNSGELDVAGALAQMFFSDSYEAAGVLYSSVGFTRELGESMGIEALRTVAVIPGQATLRTSIEAVKTIAAERRSLIPLLQRLEVDTSNLAKMATGYQTFCESVRRLHGFRVVIERLLASEGHVHLPRKPEWHVRVLGRLSAEDTAERLFITDTCDASDTRPDEPASNVSHTAHNRMTEIHDDQLLALFSEMSVLARPVWQCPDSAKTRKGLHSGEVQDGISQSNNIYAGIRRSLLDQRALGSRALDQFVRRAPLSQVYRTICGIVASRAVKDNPRLQ